MTRALLDTSLVLDRAAGKLEVIPDRPTEAAISAVTLCELHHGVLRAPETQRAGRLAALAYAERTFSALPVDARIAPHYARLMTSTQRMRGRRLRVADALIAATAVAHHLTLYTRDRDFEGLPDLNVVLA